MSPEAVADLLQRRHPSLDARAVEPLGEGDFCHAYTAGGAWVVRVARHAEAAAALKRESCLLPRVAARLELRIPRPAFHFPGEGDDPAFSVHALLPGPELTRERYLALPEADRDACARQVARFLDQLHRTEPTLAVACGIPREDYRARFTALLKRVRAELGGVLSAEGRAYAERAVSGYLASGAATGFRPVLLHGDLSPDHVLYDEAEGRVTAVIDFGDMALGDPAWDLTYVYDDYGLDFLGRLMDGFGDREVDRKGLLRRGYRFHEMNVVAWVLECRDAGDEETLAESIALLETLRAREESPPWRALL